MRLSLRAVSCLPRWASLSPTCAHTIILSHGTACASQNMFPAACFIYFPLCMCAFLYRLHSLPFFLPPTDGSANLIFSGALRQPVYKVVTLTNPSSREMDYRVRLDGCRDFTVPQQHVTVPPREETKITLAFTPRFTKPATAMLYLIPDMSYDGPRIIFNA